MGNRRGTSLGTPAIGQDELTPKESTWVGFHGREPESVFNAEGPISVHRAPAFLAVLAAFLVKIGPNR